MDNQYHPELIDDSVFIAPGAVILDDVRIGAQSSVWYTAVLRGDTDTIIIGPRTNVQDGAVIHVTPAHGVEVGAGATVGHLCVVHGAALGEECLVGNGSTVLDGVRIGPRAMVAAGALVTPGTEVAEGMLAVGVPARVKGSVVGTPAEFWVRANPAAYQALAQRHKAGVEPA